MIETDKTRCADCKRYDCTCVGEPKPRAMKTADEWLVMRPTEATPLSGVIKYIEAIQADALASRKTERLADVSRVQVKCAEILMSYYGGNKYSVFAHARDAILKDDPAKLLEKKT